MNGSYNNGFKMNLNIMEPLAEHESTFEPQTRARSNTWPLPRPENYVEPGDGSDNGQTVQTPGLTATSGVNKCPVPPQAAAGSVVPTKKNSSRRNAWGNLSYADLITQAITTSPDNRLTLSQIYEWMVQNVPYFKDKGDSNSSAGWKNSIRHNLSLHNRFMRVQNEGTGKSSWWMINPDAKPGKSVRRRAASMETSKFEKRRGRVKKKVEMMRNGCLPDTAPSPSSSVSESLDLFPDSPPIHSSGGFPLSPDFRPRAQSNPSVFSGGGFQLSPDFRPRASSNTSSCGRLSPIPAVGNEPDWSTPSAFNNGSNTFTTSGGASVVTATTSDLAAATTTGGGSYSPDQLAGNLEQRMKLQQTEQYMGYLNGQTNPSQPPPPYTASYDQFNNRCRDFNALHATSPYACPIHRMQSCNCLPSCVKVENMSSPADMSPSYPHSDSSPDPLSNHQYLINRMPRPPSSSPPLTPQSQGTPSTMMGQFIGALNSSIIADDLNINLESLQGGFECNVEELIKHELNMEGSLDFNFSSQQQTSTLIQPSIDTNISSSQTSAPPAYSSAVTTPSWVH